VSEIQITLMASTWTMRGMLSICESTHYNMISSSMHRSQNF